MATDLLGTFSKVLFSTLRLGYLIAPLQLVEPLLAVRRFIDMHLPLLEQAVVADFMNEGHFTLHIRCMRLLYAARRSALVSALQRECAGALEVSAPEVGMHLIGWLPTGVSDRLVARQLAGQLKQVGNIVRNGVSDRLVARQLAGQGVQTLPLSVLCLEPLPRGALLLGYAAVNEREIEEGVHRLVSANSYLFLT